MPQHAQANLAALIESADDLIWSVDLDYRLLTSNRAFRRTYRNSYGFKASAGMKPENLFPPEKAALWRSYFERALKQGPFRIEYPFAEARFLELSLNPIVEDGEAIGVSIFGKDITDRKASEIALLEAKQKIESEVHDRKFQLALIHAIQKVSLDGILVVDSNGVIVSVNKRLFDVWQIPSPYFSDSSGDWIDRTAGFPLEPFLSSVLNLVKDSETLLDWARNLHADRSMNDHREVELKDGRALELYSTGFWAEEEQFQGRVWFVRDITERKRTEEKYRVIYSGSNEGIFQTTIEGNAVSANPALMKMLGYDPSDDISSVIKNTITDIWVNPDERNRYIQLLEEFGSVREFECQFKRKDGSLIWVSLSARKTYADDGRPINEGFINDITERKQAEQALHSSEEMFRQFAENVRAVIYMIPRTPNESHYVSPAYEEIWGRSRESLYQNPLSWMEAIHPDDRTDAQARFSRQLLGEPSVSEYRIVTPDNEVKWIQDRAFPILDKDGRFIRLGGISTDISEQKRHESEIAKTIRALEASEQRFRDIFEQAAVGIVQTSLEGRLVKCNSRFAEIVGYSVDEIPGMTVQQITWPEDHFASNAVIEQMKISNPEPLMLEKRYLRKDGSFIWARATVSVQRDEEGHALQIVTLVEDISARKAAERRLANTIKVLQASEERYSKLIDLSPDAILVERNRAIHIANRAAIKLFGVSSAEDLIGKKFADFVSPEEREATEELMQRLYSREMQMPLQEMQILDNGGQLLDLEVAASSFYENKEMVVQVISHNITHRKKAEAKQAQLIRGIEQVDESIFITDLDGVIIYVNPAFEKVTGYTREEAIGNSTRLLKSGSHSEAFYRVMWDTLLSGETWFGDLVNRRKDGTLYNEVATISPIRDQSGTVVSFVAVNRDMTKEQLLRDQLNQAQKMESMGRLAGGIAHDFNNLLMVIRTYSEMLQGRLAPDDKLRTNAEQILKAVDRGASLTGQMLAFSRKQIISPVVLDLNAVIEDAAKMLRRVIGEDIEFHVALSERLWAIESDPDQIVQILMNLCVNARDAMPRGGTLTIETKNTIVQTESAGNGHGVLPGEYVSLSVTDSGVGIGKEFLKDVFEPFFTTKDVGKGTGLGLATIYGIVKQSGGHVWVESELGHGARFTVYLPKAERTITPTVPGPTSAPQGGSETLLVVEDEEPLRKGICELLDSLGYKVISACSGEAALSILGEQDHIDLLLTDVVMPKMSGRELAQILGKQRPELKIIYMSGYTDDAVLRYGIHELHTAFLQKPFGLAALARKVRETLGHTESTQHDNHATGDSIVSQKEMEQPE